MSKRQNGDMIELRRQRVSSGRARDCVRCSLAKVLFAVGGKKKFGVTLSFVCLVIWGEAFVVSIKVAQR